MAELIDAVFQRLNDQVADYVETHPLEQLEYGRDSPLGRWLAMSTYYALSGQVPPPGEMNPVHSLAEVFEQSFGIDHRTARLRAAQVTAISMGWRLFETYLVAAPSSMPSASIDCDTISTRSSVRSDRPRGRRRSTNHHPEVARAQKGVGT